MNLTGSKSCHIQEKSCLFAQGRNVNSAGVGVAVLRKKRKC